MGLPVVSRSFLRCLVVKQDFYSVPGGQSGLFYTYKDFKSLWEAVKISYWIQKSSQSL